jgi:hypothetical protein
MRLGRTTSASKHLPPFIKGTIDILLKFHPRIGINRLNNHNITWLPIQVQASLVSNVKLASIDLEFDI